MDEKADQSILIRYDDPVDVGPLAHTRVETAIAPATSGPLAFWNLNAGNADVLSLVDPDKRFGPNPSFIGIEKQVRLLNLPFGTPSVGGVRNLRGLAAFSDRNEDFLLVADTGDPNKNRVFSNLHLLKPPAPTDYEVRIEETVRIRFPERSRNVVSVGVSVVTGRIEVIMISDDRPKAKLFRLFWPQEPSLEIVEAEPVGELQFNSATDIDISPDSRRAVVATKDSAHQYVRGKNETFADVLNNPGSVVEIGKVAGRVTGASIAYGEDGKTLISGFDKRQGGNPSIFVTSPLG